MLVLFKRTVASVVKEVLGRKQENVMGNTPTEYATGKTQMSSS